MRPIPNLLLFTLVVLPTAAVVHAVDAAPGAGARSRIDLVPVPEPPTIPELPAELLLPRLAGRVSTTSDEPVAEAAERAAWTMAADLVHEEARRAYYLAGMQTGLRVAVGRSDLGVWEFHEGIQFGRSDPAVLEPGTPVAQPGLRPPPPSLEDAFHDVPLVSAIDMGAESEDLWRIYRGDDPQAGFPNAWSQPARAFELWCRRHPSDASFERWSEPDRHRFRRVFELSYPGALARQLGDVPERLYRQGFLDGWAFGVRIRREWDFQRGYHLGFEERTREVAADRSLYLLESLPRDSIERQQQEEAARDALGRPSRQLGGARQ